MPRTAKRVVRRDWTRQDERELKRHSKARTPVKAMSKTLKRTPGALRQKARHLGFDLDTDGLEDSQALTSWVLSFRVSGHQAYCWIS